MLQTNDAWHIYVDLFVTDKLWFDKKTLLDDLLLMYNKYIDAWKVLIQSMLKALTMHNLSQIALNHWNIFIIYLNALKDRGPFTLGNYLTTCFVYVLKNAYFPGNLDLICLWSVVGNQFTWRNSGSTCYLKQCKPLYCHAAHIYNTDYTHNAIYTILKQHSSCSKHFVWTLSCETFSWGEGIFESDNINSIKITIKNPKAALFWPGWWWIGEGRGILLVWTPVQYTICT